MTGALAAFALIIAMLTFAYFYSVYEDKHEAHGA